MSASAFFDTNILIYASLQPDQRSDAARALLTQGGVIRVQVLNEFTSVARRRLNRPWLEIRHALQAIRVLCPSPRPITMDTHESALSLAERSGYQIYGALIIASALEAGCDTLLSEDLHDGQVIERRLTIRNPFASLTR